MPDELGLDFQDFFLSLMEGIRIEAYCLREGIERFGIFVEDTVGFPQR